MKNLFIYILAKILKFVLSPIAHLYAVLTLNPRSHSLYLRELALAEDCYGNKLLSPMLNRIFIKSSGYKFGNRRETISSVLGKNKVKGTLTFIGKSFNYILDVIDRNHSIKSIDYTINNGIF